MEVIRFKPNCYIINSGDCLEHAIFSPKAFRQRFSHRLIVVSACTVVNVFETGETITLVLTSGQYV